MQSHRCCAYQKGKRGARLKKTQLCVYGEDSSYNCANNKPFESTLTAIQLQGGTSKGDGDALSIRACSRGVTEVRIRSKQAKRREERGSGQYRIQSNICTELKERSVGARLVTDEMHKTHPHREIMKTNRISCCHYVNRAV